MNSLLTNPAEFAALLQRFFTERLLQQRHASPRTIAAYRDTFRLLLKYAEREKGKSPTRLALIDFDAPLVVNFLAYLEFERHNTVRTRNARLATIRAFAHYVALQCPPALQLAQQIQAIPMNALKNLCSAFFLARKFKLCSPLPTAAPGVASAIASC